ncbi:sensor histidine kinase [Thetidibacter halocola]|uniref:histidine kinase n=1 Tax=Thetidibacter halocola TaxID=2827239 RepID=A0A8J7W981_9RHOB|nr:ATP-binding protein [Thetidibacter halocola]MBS0122562.1 two-component sensor histidine kinase [Thetidibacter halocola]
MTQAAACLDAFPLPALLVRADERIEAANAEARALFGQGIAGRHFITALRQPVLIEAVETCLREGQAREVEYLARVDQRDVTFRVTVRPVDAGARASALVCLQDTSAVQRAGQIRRDFVANVSHELRTPLTALIGFIETLRGPARNDPKGQERFLSIMEREAHRMNRLVGDLLSLSRVEAEERVRPTEPVDPAALIQSCLHGLAPLAAEAGVTLRADLPEAPVRIPADPDQLRQVLTNLCENAIKYGGRGCVVTVTLTGPDYEPRLRALGVRIAVRDTGPGIDPHHIPRLTERFYRVDDHRSREMGGTGLGLAIVKHIVNRHRGWLRIDSTPGEGSVFTLILPADPAEAGGSQGQRGLS